jgi:hypothetical protein
MNYTAEDARTIRRYCVKMVRTMDKQTRLYGGTQRWDGERAGLMYILGMMRSRRNERKERRAAK